MDYLIKLIEQLIFENPQGLKRLLYEYTGYTGQLDVDAVLSAYVLCGDLFLSDLFRVFSFDYAEGETTTESGKDYNKFQEFWHDATGFLSGVGAIAQASTNNKSEEQEAIKQKKIWNVFIWTSILLVFVLLILALIIHKK